LVRKFLYVFGAVSPLDGQHDSLLLPWANTKAMSTFLEELARRHPGEYLLLIVDGAGWHRAGALRIPANIEFGFLPPCCPDLNPQEHVWEELREKAIGNRVLATLEAVADAAVTGLQTLEKAPERLRSLASRQWMLRSV
jgi:transposase